ncbi:MAG: DNA polymerase/3'-5' exonuclease PolX [Deltaproteobacteria bacterium]|nr:DNA polymerase/3'-5' exonuclease PolX [Deltaproteobacteria bacterium]
MTNREIARVFEHIAEILSIQAENPFKVRAYTRAAQTIADLSYPLSSLPSQAEIEKLPGIGKAIAQKSWELIQTGKLGYYEKLLSTPHARLTEFLRIPGLGPKHAKLIYDHLGIDSVDALRAAAERGELESLPGMGKKTQAKILQGIEQALKYKQRSSLAEMHPRAQAILEQLSGLDPVEQISLAGSLRRMRDTVADVDILVASDQADPVMDAFVSLPEVADVLARGPTKSSILTRDGFQVDLRVVARESFGAAMHYFTGSKNHNIRIRALGQEAGLKINEYGVFRGKRRIGGQTEEEIFGLLGLAFIPPELREDHGEIEAAQAGELPALVELADIRGDLHVHSRWTDGRNSIEEMALAARKRGLRYIAICDHSSALKMARGLDRARLQEQMREIDELNRKIKSFAVLKGIEVDILADGRLDLEDEVLAELDVVVAAVHSRFDLSRAEMTARLVKAIENPQVNILAHPTGRIISKREPYPLDLDAVMDACLACNTFLEVNSFPERLDLCDIHCRQARDRGVDLAISTDSHRIDHYDWLKFGIATARRGWIEKRHVINALDLKALRRKLRKAR